MTWPHTARRGHRVTAAICVLADQVALITPACKLRNASYAKPYNQKCSISLMHTPLSAAQTLQCAAYAVTLAMQWRSSSRAPGPALPAMAAAPPTYATQAASSWRASPFPAHVFPLQAASVDDAALPSYGLRLANADSARGHYDIRSQKGLGMSIDGVVCWCLSHTCSSEQRVQCG